MLEKPGGFPSKRVGADSPGADYQLIPRQGAPGFTPWGRGVGRVTERGFLVSETAHLLPGLPWPAMPCRLSGRKPASQPDTSKVDE